ncbi:MAG TPA: hypothetical protein VMS11_09840 [Solirubrobacterales bacterium]|nr:hypothetical protein [Solirubrobacterales bacterium]
MGLFLTTAPAQAAIGDPFGLESFSNHTTAVGGAPYTDAGGHPDLNVTEFFVPLKPGGGGLVPVETFNGTYVNPPLGFIGNPAAAPRCPFSKIAGPNVPGGLCPSGSQVGIVDAIGLDIGTDRPLYNLPPEYGYPAQFGFKIGGFSTVLSAFLLPRTSSYGLTVGTPNIPAVGVYGANVEFFGTPSEHGLGTSGAPFLSNPVDCSEADPTWRIAIDSVEHAGALVGLGVPDLSDPDWKTDSEAAPPVTNCEALVFDPSLAVDPLQPGGPVQADQPTGLRVGLDFPQTNDPTDPEYIKHEKEFDPSIPQTPPPKDITVKLPAGLGVSPSSATGLGACSDLASDPAGDQVHYDNTKPVSCPDSAKIGSAVATSPLLATHEPNSDEVNGAEPIPGDVYLLKPHPGDLPIGGGNQQGKFRLLIQLENPRYGINIKLPGIATADPQTGQLTTVFTQNPQLPASHITVSLKEGPRAPLATPVTCGSFKTTSDLVPWSTPGTPDAHPSADFSVTSGPHGSGCPLSPAARPFAPGLSAGTESNAAGASSPFVLHLTRNDGEQEFSSLEATLPKGLAAKFVGVPYCSDAALATAATRAGKAEQTNPTCPASRIGSVTVGAGPGTNPFYAHGTAYLAGPYKGAPMSVAVITPAVAGPFDLGSVVVRNALFIDPETAQGHVVSDPFPKILDGIPLKLRSIDVNLDRPSFTLNPTSCEAKSIDVKVTSTDGATASPTNYFQAAGCKNLGFKPRFSLSLKGGTKRTKHPALKSVLTYPKGAYANIAKAQVILPRSEFIDQNHVGNPCTRPQFAAGECPKISILGKAKAWTPLLDQPLEGNVYFRANGGERELPDIVADLNGQIHVTLVGFVDAVTKKGSEVSRIRTTFANVPDAPVSKFVLELKGGKEGLLVNSANLCKSPHKAIANFTAQNGRVFNTEPVIPTSCKKKGGKKHAK